VVDAVAERRDVIVVGYSLGGFTAHSSARASLPTC
jgi:predicted dienelactone hydrolase